MGLNIAQAISKPSTKAFVELQEIPWAENRITACDKLENGAQNLLEHQLLNTFECLETINILN